MAKRLLLLFGAIAVGYAVGFLGDRITGSPAWFLAIPGAVMLAWLRVADPTQCLPRHGDSRPGDSPSE